MDDLMKHFEDPEAVARYAEGPPRFVPGFEDLHRMVGILLAEQMPTSGRVLVLGAGGGLELRYLAENFPDWTFEGVDPSRQMLQLAVQTLGPFASRVAFTEGRIEDASSGPFDAAVCLLTLHFMPFEERRAVVKAIGQRLKTEATLVVAHSSFPQAAGEREQWLNRYAAFANARGVRFEDADNARKSVSRNLAILSPEQDQQVLEEAGFEDVSLFYAAFTWRGWFAKKAE